MEGEGRGEGRQGGREGMEVAKRKGGQMRLYL
jgi:hypothetical protein